MTAGHTEDEASRDALAELARLEQNERLAAQERPAQAPAQAPPAEPAYTRPEPRPQTVYARPEVAGMPPVPPLPPLFPTASAPALGVPSMPRDLRSLEDGYAVYPELGMGGAYYLRVERNEPKLHQGIRVDGDIGSLHERLSTDEFRQRFGGFRYTLYVMGPTAGRGSEPGAVRTLNKIELKFPDVPRFPEMQNPTYPAQGQPPQVFGQIDHPQVAIRKLDLEAEERRRAYDQTQPSQQAMSAFAQNSAETVRLAKEMASQQVQQYASMLTDVQAQYRKLEERVQVLQEEKTHLHRELAEAKSYSETTQIKELKERHERDMRDLKEAHERELRGQKERSEDQIRSKTEEYQREKDRISTTFRDQLDSETRRHTDERAKLYEDARTAREDDRRSSTERVEAMRHDHDARERSMKDTYELQLRASETTRKESLESMERHHREQVQSMKEAHDRELRLLGDNSNVKERVIGESTKMQVSMIQSELSRVRAEAEGLESELRQATEKLHKEPGEYLTEVSTVAKTMLGYKSPDEVKDAEDKNKKIDWSEVAGKTVMTLSEKLPDIAKDVLAARNKAQQAQQQQAATQQAHQNAMQQGQQQLPPHVVAAMQAEEHRRRMMGPGPGQQPQQAPQQQPQQARRPGVMATPPPWMLQHQGNVRMVQAPPSVAMRPSGAVTMVTPSGPAQIPTTGIPDIEQPSSPGAAPFPKQAQPGATPGSPPHASDAQMASHQPPMSVQPQQPPQQQAPPPPPYPEQGQVPTEQAPGVIDPRQLGKFFESLSNAIDHGMAPATFAALIVGDVGPEATRDLLRQVDAQRVISTLQELGQQQPELLTSSILTREGERFTREVFAEARKAVGM